MFRTLSIIIVAVAIGIIAYVIGQRVGRREARTELVENYTFVKDIAELASLEVGGTTTFKSSNIDADDNGILGSLKKSFFENSVSLTVPFTAKYGVDLGRDSVQILPEGDSMLRLILPMPKLLSYELHLDRIQTTQQSGYLYFENEPFKKALYQKLYSQSRQELLQNRVYLTRTQDRICAILQGYYRAAQMRVQCQFGTAVPRLQ